MRCDALHSVAFSHFSLIDSAPVQSSKSGATVERRLLSLLLLALLRRCGCTPDVPVSTHNGSSRRSPAGPSRTAPLHDLPPD